MNAPLNKPPGTGLLDAPLTEVFRPHFPQLRRAFFVTLIVGLLVLSPSVYMLEVYSRVVDARSLSTLLALSLAVVMAFALMEVLEWLRSELLHSVGEEADKRITPRIFNLMFEANLKRQSGGSLQVLNDWRQVRDFLTQPFLSSLMELPVAAIFLVLVFQISPYLGWLTVAAAAIQVFLSWLMSTLTQPLLRAASQSSVQAQTYADSSLLNAEVVEALGMLRGIHTRWIRMQREFLGLQARASNTGGVIQALTKMIQLTLSSALLGLSVWLLLNNELHGGPGMMIVSSIVGGRVLIPLVQMVSQAQVALNALEAWRRVNTVLAAMPERSPAMSLPSPRGLLTVNDLSASTPVQPGQAQQFILRGLNFTVNPGELLAVVGPSAAGKTTLARLITGLWPAAGGKVRLDGVDVYQWDKRELGPHVGYLPQGIELFEGTISENIARFGVLNPEKVRAAAEAAGVHEIILGMPKGYETPVGRGGAILSGGQRQRVALARALYGEPVLIVLDEPSSSLDEAGDAALQRALVELKERHATIVVITHRTSVLSVTDKILVLRDGAQQAFGPRDEVLTSLNRTQAQVATRGPQSAQPAAGQNA